MAFTTLAGSVFKISGTAIGAGGTIAAGTTLTTARLTTIDEDQGPVGAIQFNYDAYNLIASETLSIRIDGVQIGTTIPQLFTTQITTNTGSFAALAFTFGGDTYLLPRSGADFGATTVTAQATLSVGVATGITASQYGLIPENANTYSGQVYTEVSGFGPTSTSVTAATIYDADGIRGNADSQGEEVGAGSLARISEATETLSTLHFSDGTSLAGVEGLVTILSQPYGPYTYQFLFNESKLAAAGKTLADIVDTDWQASSHNLNWAELGLDLTATGNGIITADPAPAPPPNVITGTKAANTLIGTDGVDVIRGLGGNDLMQGGGGADFFVFGNETRDGRRNTDTIREFDITQDKIIFEDSAVVTNVRNIAGGVQITFAGDGDKVNVYGTGLNLYTSNIFADDNFPFI